MPLGPVFDSSALDGSDGFQINADGSGDFFGAAVATGDVNGDGFDDLLIGAFNAAIGKGETYLIFGTGGPVDALASVATLDASEGYRFDGKLICGKPKRRVSAHKHLSLAFQK